MSSTSSCSTRATQQTVGADVNILHAEEIEIRPDEECSSERCALNAVLCCKKETWNFDQVLAVLPTAVAYNMPSVTKQLSSFLMKSLSLSNCIRTLQLASKLELVDLWEISCSTIRTNFELIATREKDFVNLDMEQLRIFVFSDQLHVSEENVFRGICRWIQWDMCNRRDKASVLLHAVRFTSCSLRFLLEIGDHDFVADQDDIRDQVLEAIEILSRLPEDDSQLITSNWRWIPEQNLTGTNNSVLFVMGGCGERSIETFDTKRKSWILNKNFSRAPSGTTGIVCVDKMVYAVEPYKERVSSFDPTKKVWTDLQPMPVFRKGFCLAPTNRGFYAIGGDGYGAKCDFYDIQEDTWKEATKINLARTYASCATLNDKIYCSGGGNCFQYFDSMETHCPNTDVWSWATSMAVQRAGHSMTACGKYLWAVGGYNRKGFLNDLEKYDPEMDKWTTMRPMPTKRNVLTSSFYAGLIFAIGGFDDKEHNTTEVYNPTSNRWTTYSLINKSRICLGSCVVRDLDNAWEYTEQVSSNELSSSKRKTTEEHDYQRP